MTFFRYGISIPKMVEPDNPVFVDEFLVIAPLYYQK
jgi:hypothetical protein